MIAKALEQIVDNLNDYLDLKLTGANQLYRAEIINIKKANNGNADPGIKVALINVEEDKVYKNHLTPIAGRAPKSTDPIHPQNGKFNMRINLYVLFAFNPKNSDSQGYLDSLSVLTHVLRYFQSNSYQEISIPIPSSPPQVFGLDVEYHNISLEDSNNMWSNLGGEQRPYAMYRIKMLEIEQEMPTPDQLIAVLQETTISSPSYNEKGKTLFNPDGSPKNDTNEIQHSINKNKN